MKEEYYTLDLSKNNLTEIPITYKRVHWLILSNNNLINTKNIQYYRDVTRLALNDNYLMKLESAINALVNLNWLDLTRNRLCELPFINLKNLNGLGLSENNFDKIPSCVFNLINLRKFGFFSNRLKVISPLIGNLINLTKLDLSNNYIKTLPKELFSLKKLTWLNLSNNRIESVEGINNLVHLEELGLGNNQIEEIDIALTSLKILPLFNNKIRKVRIRMTRIEKLDFSDNLLEYFDWRVLECKKLKYLNLKNNRIKEIRLEGMESTGYCYGYVRYSNVGGDGGRYEEYSRSTATSEGRGCSGVGECVFGTGYGGWTRSREYVKGWNRSRADYRNEGSSKGGFSDYRNGMNVGNGTNVRNDMNVRNGMNVGSGTNVRNGFNDGDRNGCRNGCRNDCRNDYKNGFNGGRIVGSRGSKNNGDRNTGDKNNFSNNNRNNFSNGGRNGLTKGNRNNSYNSNRNNLTSTNKGSRNNLNNNGNNSNDVNNDKNKSTGDNHGGSTYYSRYNGNTHNFNSVHEKYGSIITDTLKFTSKNTDITSNYIPLFTNTRTYTQYSTFYDLSVSPNLSVLDLSNNHIRYIPFSYYFKLKHVNTLRVSGNEFERGMDVSGDIGTLSEICFGRIINRNMHSTDGSSPIGRELMSTSGEHVPDSRDGNAVPGSNWSNRPAYTNAVPFNRTIPTVNSTHSFTNSSIHFNKISFNCSKDTSPINPTKLKHKRQCDTCLRYFISDPFLKYMEYNDIVLLFALCSAKCGNGFIDKG